MKTLLLHLGLGDTIVLSGAVVTLAERHGGLIVPCYPHNFQSVMSFFIHHPEVYLRPVATEAEMVQGRKPDDLGCGYYHEDAPQSGELFDEWTYRQLEVPLDHRWGRCPIPQVAKLIEPHALTPPWPYAFVHDDLRRGFGIVKRGIDLPIRQPSPVGSILAWCSFLEHASEVHVINSSFWHLAEALHPVGKLYLHRYARTEYDPVNFCTTRHPWTVLNAPAHA